MRRLTYLLALMALTMVASCGNNAAQKAEQEPQDSTALADSNNDAIADSTAQVDATIAFITDFYNSKKFENEEFLKAHCSAEVLKKLADDYEYEGGGLASWDFRSGYQDGPSDRHEIISVESLNDNWYLYTFYDMGNKGSHKIRVIQEDEDFVIDGIQ
jgi:hypothetical protein